MLTYAERRTNYTRYLPQQLHSLLHLLALPVQRVQNTDAAGGGSSLALMSIVGYILGLGDRHPSNLMLHRYSGKLVHVDFGDCFEVATPITALLRLYTGPIKALFRPY